MSANAYDRPPGAAGLSGMPDDAQTVECLICPKECAIPPGGRGDCRIRVNLDGRLVATTYGFPCAIHVDPMEKKPLFHFLPGTPILSLATAGCNLHCKNCQNWEISQGNPEEVAAVSASPARVVQLARTSACSSLAATYTEPIAFFEYTLDIFRAAREAGLRTVLVTAGYVNDDPWRELCRETHAANIDLKSMSDRFYRDVCDGDLATVQRSLVTAKEAGIWVEVTNLVIPTLNDSDTDLKTLARWVRQNLGPDTPVHYSAFYPQYRMRHLPPTSPETLRRARAIGQAEGLRFVYAGNVMIEDGETTFCPACLRPVLQRHRFEVIENRIVDGFCGACGVPVAGVWK